MTESRYMLPELVPRNLLADLFEQFDSLPITPDGRLAAGEHTYEGEEIENYFRGLRWPDLIYYFKRWDTCLASISFMTPAGFRLTLPAYVAAALLWPDVLDTGPLLRVLLAPAMKEPECLDETRQACSGISLDDHASVRAGRTQTFEVVHESLSPSQRAAVGRALKYLVQHDPGYPGSDAGLTMSEIQTEIERLWNL